MLMEDNVNFIDKDDKSVKKGPTNQLRTRPSSFERIKNAWRNWRVARTVKKIEQKKKNLLQEEFKADFNGSLTDAAKKKIEKNSKLIARLEEKSMRILALEGVPRGFVSSRAIKLREKMYSHLVSNGVNAYSVGFDKYDEVFGPDKVLDNSVLDSVDIPTPIENSDNTVFVPPSVVNDVVGESEVSNSQIPEPVEADASQVTGPVESPIIPDAPLVGVDEYSKVIVDGIDAIPGPEPEEEKTVIPVTPEEVQKTVGVVNETTTDAITKEVNDVLSQIDGIAADTVMDDSNMKNIGLELDNVKYNQDSSAKIGKYNEDGRESVKTWEDDSSKDSVVDNVVEESEQDKDTNAINESVVLDNSVDSQENIPEFAVVTEDKIEVPQEPEASTSIRGWTPLSDEEIAAAQQDLISHGMMSANDDSSEVNNIRDDTVVIPERGVDEQEMVVEHEQFDNSASEVKVDEIVEGEDVVKKVEGSTSIEELEELKRSVEELKERQRKTKEAKDESERRAQSISDQVAKARDARAKSDVLVDEAVAKLRDYHDALAEDCEFNRNRAEMAAADAERNEQLLREEEDIISQNNELISSISSLIDTEAVEVKPKSR